MYELRILSGLHRGATLPLEERDHFLGASEDADVVILDDGISNRHAVLRWVNSAWVLSPEEGQVRGENSNAPCDELSLMPGQFGRVGHVWVAVARRDDAWENPPPEPQDLPPAPEMEEIAADPVAQEADASELAGDQESAALGADNPEAVQDAKQRKRRSNAFYLPLALLALVTACAAFAFTKDTKVVLPPAAKQPGAETKPADGNPGKEVRPISQDELRTAFRKRLADVDLLKRFDLDLQNGNWTMRAELDDDESARFERVLAAFLHENKIDFPVRAIVGGAEMMLPFKIREVISGANASVVTQNGERLYIGDEYRGVRLAAISGSRVTFFGKRKIEVRW